MRLVSILILTGQCFLFEKKLKELKEMNGFNPYFNWTMFLIAFFHLFPFIYLFYDRKYVAVFP